MTAVNYSACPKCASAKLPHAACGKCGYLNPDVSLEQLMAK